MNRDNSNGITRFTHMAALYRGIYSRVADRLGVDPSYVSRVARGERQSEQVRVALDSELAQIARSFAKHSSESGRKKSSGKHGNGVSARR